MSDNVSLLDVSRGNVATDALSNASLSDGIAWMRKQTENGISLNIKATHLVVAPTLEEDARAVLRERDVQGLPDVKLRIEPRLENGVTDPVTGTTVSGSSTQWFLIAGDQPNIEIGTAQRQPQIRRFVADRGTWGFVFDVRWLVGAQAVDYRGIYRGNS